MPAPVPRGTRAVRRAGLATVAIVLAGQLLAACGGGAASSGDQTSAPPPSLPASPSAAAPTASSSSTSAAATTPADSCAVGAQPPAPTPITVTAATALRFAPDGRLFWTERAGTVRVWQDGSARTFASVSTVTAEPGNAYSERGLLGLAISPTFASDRFVYAFYSDSDRATQHVVRWRDCAGQGMDATTLITLPAGPDCCHKGGRLAFGPDGMLYVTLGEEHTAAAAQDTADVRGKVLRYRPDGTVPTDNPFGPSDPVYAYGLRNPFGIAISPSGQIAVTNNGPSGDAGSPSTGYDTLVASIARGRGYQWPACYGYSHPLAASSCPADQPGPDWSSETSTVIPTGVALVDAAGPSGYAGHIVFCTYASGMRIYTPGAPHGTVSNGPSGCTLDVVEGPDHALWYSGDRRIDRLAA